MKAIALVRVSTAVQDLQQQTDAVKKEILKDGYKEEDIIPIENTESAVKLSEEERQGLNKMKRFIESDSSIDAVYVFELSRLSRRPEVLYSIRDYLLNKGIQLVVIKPPMRLFNDGRPSESASIMFAIFGALAEQEGFIRKERFARGKKKAQLEGKSLGNWLPLGYTTDEKRYIIIDEDKANLVRKIFNMCLIDNKSTTAIARELSETGEFPVKTTIRANSSSILNILRNTAYIGKAPFNKRRQKENYNQYPPIIPPEMFNSVQDLLSQRKKLPKTEHKNIYYCKGLLKDKTSGYVLRAVPAVASYCFHSDPADPHKYPSITVPINLFDCFAWHLTIQYNKQTPEDTEKMRAGLLKEIEILDKKVSTAKRQQNELEKQITRIQERIILGKMKESLGDSMLEEIYRKQDELSYDISRWGLEAFNKSAYYHATAMIDDIGDNNDLSLITEDAKRYALIHEAIKEIIIEKGGMPEPGRIRKRGLGVKYGVMEVHYKNNQIEQYKYNSYTKKCFTMDDVEVPYKFELRIKGQQHQPDYQIKNKKWREEHKKK